LLSAVPDDILQSLAQMTPADDLSPAILPEIVEPEVLTPAPAQLAGIDSKSTGVESQDEAATSSTAKAAASAAQVAPPVDPMFQALQELAQLSSGPEAARAGVFPEGHSPPQRTPHWVWIVLPGLLIGAAAAGFAAGRKFAPRTANDLISSSLLESVAKSAAAAPAESDVANDTESANARSGQLEGRVLYANASGTAQPDSGAIVLLLPLKNPTSLRFAAGSLRDSERTPARSAVEAGLAALSGSLARADEDGRFQIVRRESGPAALLIVSQHTTRPAEEPWPDSVQSVAAAWLDSPQSLIGRLQVQVQALPARSDTGSRAEPQQLPDIHFPAAP
jgi:hypothetical protein